MIAQETFTLEHVQDLQTGRKCDPSLLERLWRDFAGRASYCQFRIFLN